MLIHLSDDEQTILRHVAPLRTLQSRQADIPNERIAKTSDAIIELEGMAAEWAFCKALNIYPDLFGGPRTHDCVYYGATVDVKSTQYEQGQLIVRPEKIDDPCDYYALVTGTFPGPYALRGVASKEEIFYPSRKTDLGYGPVYAMPQNQLYPFERWKDDMFLLTN